MPFYSVENVTSRDFSNTKFISEKEHQFLTRSSRIEKGDILMTRIGSIGECVLIDWDVDASFYVSLALLKVHGAYAPFVAAYSGSSSFKEEIDLHSLSYAIPKKINLGPISNVRIPFPIHSEQRAIAEALSDVDKLLESLDALIAKKRAIKQATMQQLLTGKTRLPGFSGDWQEKHLFELSTITMGQSPDSMHYNLCGSGFPLIQGNADIENRRTIQRVWTTQGSKYCDSGDLLLTVRAPVGSVAIASENVCIGRGVCALRPFGGSLFLFHALIRVESVWRILEQGSTFTAANSEQVRQFTLLVPNDEMEQKAIATVLSDMDAEITALEQRRDKTRVIKQGMMQQLLTGRVRLV